MYRPDNTLQTSKYGVNPLQKVVINIKAIDRTQPEYFPQYEGDTICVDHADYPVLISLINPSGIIQQAKPLRAGDVIKGPFKGFYISHPLLSFPGLLQTSRVFLTLGKGGAEVDNNLSQPTFGEAPCSILSTVAAGSISDVIFIPPGARFIRDLVSTFHATTVTQADWSVRSDGNAELVFAPQVGTFVTPNLLAGTFPTVAQPISGIFVCRDGLIALPASAVSVTLTMQGTVMSRSGNDSVRCVFE